ncbi:hypothetical protein [Micromonospora aurantiaca (nom. illeg.)]|uniref:hypothetical protein n=1 Tax=Micromonospora aurantiaca (nom. illeg.) TaxID=47850 RepID=UPI0033CE29DF
MSGVLLGHQRPRLELVPECSSTAALEAIDLARSVGLGLDPWQKHILNGGLGERADGMWASFLVTVIVQRQNGKGGVTEALELAGLFLWGERKIVHSAHRLDTTGAAFQRVRNLIDGSDDLTRRVKRITASDGEQFVELMTGARLEFRTRGNTGGRGLTGDRLILDEALELTGEQMAALLPILLAIPNAQVWATSTVPKFADHYLCGVRSRARAGEARRAYFEWGADKGSRLDDPAQLAAANPALGIRISLERLADLRTELGDELFARECMGIWPENDADEWRVIPKAAWLGQRDPSATMTGRPAYGVFVPPDRSYAAIAAAGQRAEGGWLVEVTGNPEHGLDFRPGTRWIVGRLKELERHQPCAVVIDDKAVADAAEQAGLIVHRPSVGDVVTGCQLLYDGVAGDTRDTWHLGQQELTDAVAGADTRPVGNSWAWNRANPTADICTLGAGSLALLGARTPRLHRPSRRPLAAFA